MTANKMLPRPSAHIAAEVDGISKDGIMVVGGAFASGTVLGKLNDGNYTQLDVTADATEAHEAEVVLYGHIDATDGPVRAVAHARVCALYDDKLTWPDAITEDQKNAAVAKLAENHIVLR
jgi:hypothetical protein